MSYETLKIRVAPTSAGAGTVHSETIALMDPVSKAIVPCFAYTCFFNTCAACPAAGGSDLHKKHVSYVIDI